jgi:peptidyl-prolyl cis-trans isomerase B (cyclophilin B)
VVLARYHYYDGSAIFRADRSIEILQGGSPTTNSASDPGPGYTIADEGGPFTYVAGQLVMARTAQPDSSGAQFFFTAGPGSSVLDSQGTYVVFGTLDEAGLAIVEQALATSIDDPTSGLGGAPSPPLVVQSVQIVES